VILLVKMTKNSMESTEPTAEIGDCKLENTAQTATKATLAPHPESHCGYESSRFNAVRHGVLSVHTVLPGEDEAEYASLLSALVEEHAPDGPTEVHLVEEIAGIIWRKRRLRLAEAASYRRGLEKTAKPGSATLDRALIQIKCTGPFWPVIDAVTATPSGTANDLDESKKRQASVQSALRILSSGKAGAYEAALAELDEPTRRSWEEEVAREVEASNGDEDPDGDIEPCTLGATGLAEFLEGCILRLCTTQLLYLENRPVIRAQVLGEALNFKKLERVSRYEVHLDRKLERMLTMLLRLQGLRRSKESG
jgi:hypothetical protein